MSAKIGALFSCDLADLSSTRGDYAGSNHIGPRLSRISAGIATAIASVMRAAGRP
jgi:hypothetical protein